MLRIYELIFRNNDTRRQARWLRLGMFMLAYYVLALSASAFAQSSWQMVSLWLPAGLAIAALARLHPRDWAAPLTGILLSDGLAHGVFYSVGEAMRYTCINGLEILAGALWLRWQFGGVLVLASVTTLLKILLAEVLVTPLIGSLLLALTDPYAATGFLETWWPRYVAGSVGMLVMLPLAIKSSIRRWHQLLAEGLFGLTGTMALITAMANVLIMAFFPDELAWCIVPLLVGALTLDFFRSTLLNVISVMSLIGFAYIQQQWGELTFGVLHYVSIAIIVLPALLLGMALHSFRQEQARLAQSEQRWKSALEGSGQGVWEIDLSRQEISASLEAQRLLGVRTAASVCSLTHWRQQIHPEDVHEASRRFDAHVAGETPLYIAEYRVRHDHGDYRWYQSRGKVMQFDDYQRPLRLVGTLTDIHATRQAELERQQLARALLEEKERLQVTLNSIGDGVIATDTTCRVVFMNPVAEEITGWRFEQAEGQLLKSIFCLRSQDTGRDITDPVSTCLERNEVCMVSDELALINRCENMLEVHATAAPVRGAGGEVMGAILVFQDISRARELQRSLIFSTSHDALTGLYNRSRFEQAVESAIEHASHEQVVIGVLNLDHFKVVNDSAGHLAGDALLVGISHLIKQHLGPADVLARLGSDEFGLLLYERDVSSATILVERMIEAIGAVRFPWEGHVYDVGASAGLMAVTEDVCSFSVLLSHVDVACHASKQYGRNRVTVYHPGQEDIEQHHRDIMMAAGLREAIESDRFVLFCQRIVPLQAGSTGDYFEVLLRMLGRDGDIIAPGAFIPVAERYGLMAAIDRWVLERVLIREGEALKEMLDGRTLSINLSANSLNEAGFLPWLLDMMARSVLSPQTLLFEITETALMNHLSLARSVVNTLRDAGCRVALDDFGSGLSSFSYLRNFKVDVIKIDGDFIRNVSDNTLDQVIVDSINQIAHRLGALTIAEFVEDERSSEQLRELGVDYAQGYYIHRPQPMTHLY